MSKTSFDSSKLSMNSLAMPAYWEPWPGKRKAIFMSRLSPHLANFFDHDRQDFMDVADNAVGCDIEDGRVGVFIDGHDYFRRLHAGHMLDRAGDAAGDVQFGTDGLAGLAHLVGIGDPSLVNRSPRRRDCAADGLCEFLDQIEVFGASKAASARHDDVRLADVD